MRRLSLLIWFINTALIFGTPAFATEFIPFDLSGYPDLHPEFRGRITHPTEGMQVFIWHHKSQTIDGHQVEYFFGKVISPMTNKPIETPKQLANEIHGPNFADRLIEGGKIGVFVLGAIQSVDAYMKRNEALYQQLRAGLNQGLNQTNRRADELRERARQQSTRRADIESRNSSDAGQMSGTIRALPMPAQPTTSVASRPAIAPESLNDQGVIHTQQIGRRGPESVLDDQVFLTPINSEFGRDLRSLANDYQSEWIRNRGYDLEPQKREVFLTGSVLLKAADANYARGDSNRGKAYQEASNLTLDILRGLKDGAYQAGEEFVKTLPELAVALKDLSLAVAQDPTIVPELAHQAMMAVPEIAEQIIADVVKDYETLRDGSAYERSVVVGRFATNRVIDYLTAGAGKAIGRAGSRITIDGTRSSKMTAKYAEAIGKSEMQLAARGTRIQKSLNLEELYARGAKVDGAIRQIESQSGKLSVQGREFLLDQVAAENKILGGSRAFGQDELVRMGQNFQMLEKNLVEVVPSKFDGTVYRAISRNFDNKEEMLFFEFTDKQIFGFSEYSWENSYRYSAPGQTGLYATVGQSLDQVEGILRAEVKSDGVLIFGEARVQSSKILDLTNPENLNKLGIDEAAIKGSSYELTQTLGAVAKSNGFEGILFPSVQGQATNIVIF